MEVLTLVVILETMIAVCFTPVVSLDCKAKVLLESDEHKTTFKLNAEVLDEISKLEGPIRVIAAIGNARVGKSTTLNLISHMWDERSVETDRVQDIFTTGDSIEAVTRNVWAYIIQHRSDKGSTLLLDVEGTNLGDDSVTDHLSMFTAMMASGLNLFARDIVANSDVNFLYRISVLSEIVFPDISLENFPKLRVVLRSNLKTPKDRNIHDLIRDSILKPNDKGLVIKKYFPRDSIEVTRIPYVKDPSLFKDFGKLRSSNYWSVLKNLTKLISNTPIKSTFNGSLLDGHALVALAKSLKDAMNSNSWPDFGNSYVLIETELCRRQMKKIMKTVSDMEAREIETQMMDFFEMFSKRCRLQSERSSFKEQLLQILDRRREYDRNQKDENTDWLTWAWKNWSVYDGILFTLGYFFSDKRLKQDIAAMPIPSLYTDIGLKGVCWKWNEIAAAKFRLTGESCGLIAQDVKKLYPWAVTKGTDGYLRVSYDLLLEVILNNA